MGVNALEQWTEAVCTELGITDAVDPERVVPLVLDLARDVAHGVARPAAPLTAFLLGVAAGRAADPRTAAASLAAQVERLVRSWEPSGG